MSITEAMVKAYRDMYAAGCANFYTEDMRVAQSLEAALSADRGEAVAWRFWQRTLNDGEGYWVLNQYRTGHPREQPLYAAAPPSPAEPLTSQHAAGQPLDRIAYGHQSHDWMASKVRMLMRNDLDHEAVCTGARDRIVWLAARVAELEASPAESADPFADKLRDSIQADDSLTAPSQVSDALREAYFLGWCNAAKWADRDDLWADRDSEAYERDELAALKSIQPHPGRGGTQGSSSCEHSVEGMVLVPVEPTQAMLDANGYSSVPDGKAWLERDARITWAAMIAAAPTAEVAK